MIDEYTILQEKYAAACDESTRAYEMNTPAMMLRPGLSIDGDKWCALYGDNLQDGVAGFGDSPAEAYQNFNKSWHEKLKGRK